MAGSKPQRPATRRRRRDRLRFALERLVLRGLRYRLLLAAATVALVAATTGTLVAVLDPEFSGLGESVWWAFLRLTDPGYLGDDEGVARRAVSTVVTVLGYVLFLGMLVAILTQWLNETISDLEAGVSPVALSDHVIILGWNHRTPLIVSELLRTRARTERFLAEHGARELRIVVLAEEVTAELARELRERLDELWDDRKVLLRTGTPLRSEHLERVAYEEAAVLILSDADFVEKNPEATDAQTVKTLLSVSRHAGEAGAPPPLAVAELCDGRRTSVARSAYAGELEILAVDEIISQLVVQSVKQRGVCDVFTELLTLHEGNSVYVRRLPSQAGTRFGELRGAFPRAILLGTVRTGEPRAALNPGPDTVLSDEDLLVFVARRFEDCVPGTRSTAAADAPAAARQWPTLAGRRLLVLGWSRKVPALIEELGLHGGGASEVDVVTSTPVKEREDALARYGLEGSGDRVRQIEASYTVPGVLERLEPGRYDNVVLLASERAEQQDRADAVTVFAYLALRSLLPEDGGPQLLVELTGEENLFLFDRSRNDVIVSPMVESYLLSQVALRRELRAVFAELAAPRGVQIVLQPASGYVASEGSFRFEELEAAAAARGEIALGLRRVRGADAGLALNPGRDAEWTLADGDLVVTLASFA